MPESYSSPPSRSSPTPTELPSLPPPEAPKFQFSLKQLLAFMLVSCGLAMVARLVVQMLGHVPHSELGQFFLWVPISLLFGAILYLMVRGPFLIWHAVRIARRWRNVSRHRQELAAWARLQTKTSHGAESQSPDKES